MARDDSVYRAPPLPFPSVPRESFSENPERDNRRDFLIDFGSWTFLNHGAFGGALRTGFDRSEQWRRYLEEQPLRYFDRALLPHLAYSGRCLAEFSQAPNKQNIALLPNVTSGMNAVLAGHAREFGKSALFIMWDVSYGSVKKMALHYYDDGNVMEIPFQATFMEQLAIAQDPEQVFVEALQDFISSNLALLEEKQVCLILDQTTSNTALNMPVKKLASAMKQVVKDALVVVDGAHGLLAQDTNVADLFSAGVDVYLSNGHKWLSAPRGVAFMAIADASLAASVLRRPAIVSHGVDEPDLFSRFVWDGCRDYSAALSIPAVLDYWHEPARVRRKCRELLREGIQRLAESWHPSVASDRTLWPFER